MKESIILYPALGRGHLLSMVELGKLIATHHPSLSITILILTPPFSDTTSSSTLSSISSAFPSISFHHLPPVPLPSTLPPHALTLELCRHSNNHLGHVINSISKTSNLKAIVLDFFAYNADTLNVPTYFYYTSGASTLALLLHFPTIHETTTKSIKDLHVSIRIPGLPTVSTDDFPDPTMDRESHFYKVFLDIAKAMRQSDGVIVNTFDAMERRAVRALSDRKITDAPDVFCVGPVISDVTCERDESGCLSWLDTQPSRSVVLLSFGSLGRFSKKQITEIAVGLEKSEQRFLWVVRSESDVYSLEELLPKGFLERTKGKGKVVLNWAPQAAILSHDSVGGFVTHCGWNSVLEAVTNGVPMVAWPLYAEQRLNRLVMVEEMKVALAVSKSEETGLVSGTELGERVKELMERERGSEIRKRICKMRMEAKEAREESGSSRVSLNKLTQLWQRKLSCSDDLDSPTSVLWGPHSTGSR